MPLAVAPIDLLRKYRAVFEQDAAGYRRKEHLAVSRLERKRAAANAYMLETFVREIDATLRDWG
jgi:hypothetical protein